MEQEVPAAPVADSILEWSQPLVTTVLVVGSAVSLRPLVTGGTGALAVGLLVLCAVHAYSRSLPDRLVPPRLRLAAAMAACVLCGLLFGVGSATWCVAWAYVVTGHVGFRFAPRLAGALTGLTVLAALLALTLGPHVADDPWPWWTALTVAGPISGGIARQNRVRTLANAQELVAQTRRAAASEAAASALAERNRIARDLHDVLAHSLSGVSLQLDTADALIEAGRYDEGRESLRAARGLAVEGLVQARDAVRTLREDALDLPATLSASVQGAHERVVLSGPVGEVPAPVGRVVVRVVQEALTNARRHAPEALVLVEVAVNAVVHVAVTNEAPPRVAAPFEHGSGLGLVGMRERVEALGGTFAAGREASGWRVAVTLPLAGAA